MAAGRGIRMRPLTDKIPKAMAQVSGKTLISRGIKKIKNKIDNIHITVGYKASLLASHVIENDVSSVFNTEGKGNAWWIYNTIIKNLNEPIFVLTCDNVFEIDFDKYFQEYIKLQSPACMIIPTQYSKEFEGDSIYFDKYRKIKNISRNNASDFICSGIQILNPKIINNITLKCENFSEVWNQLIVKDQVYCSNLILENWYAVDNLIQLINLKNKEESI